MKQIVPALLLAGLMATACNQSSPTATNDQATIVLQASPATVAPTSGVSTITAYGTKKSGAPIWDGTEIVFSTTLGTVDAKAVFQDGIARVSYHAPNAIGTATISAVSGSVQIDDIEVSVAEPVVASLVISANRVSLPVGGGSTGLRVSAYDETGRPVPNAPVIFTTTRGTLASGGRQLRTNGSGVARDTLTTDDDASVTAHSGAVNSESVAITVDDPPDNVAPTASFVWSPSSPVAGQTVFFNGELSTDDDGWITRWEWDFGDGMTARGRRVTHEYREAGTYTVVLCVTDNDRARSCTSDKSVTIGEGGR